MQKSISKSLYKKNLFSKIFKKRILGWTFTFFSIITAVFFGIDNKIILFSAFLISIFTEVFVGLGVLIGAIPFIGPFIIKVISIPIFWGLNAMGYVISAIAIKKGYATELAKSRIITLALLIGIMIGYITGNLIPLK